MNFIQSGSEKKRRRIAVIQETGNSPSLFWLGGFKSDMKGTKATAVAGMANDLGLGITRFDYSGHGQSSAEFVDGSISNWLEDTLAVFAQTKGPQIVIGSSMGAWLALLLNQELLTQSRIKALILIAPAIDMTRDLLLPSFSSKELSTLKEAGMISRPSDYDEPFILTKKLMDDGEKHCLFGAPIQTNCPVHILQGGKDEAVPSAHALKLVSHILLDPVFFSLVPDGDHSLSRATDLVMLKKTIEQAMTAEG